MGKVAGFLIKLHLAEGYAPKSEVPVDKPLPDGCPCEECGLPEKGHPTKAMSILAKYPKGPLWDSYKKSLVEGSFKVEGMGSPSFSSQWSGVHGSSIRSIVVCTCGHQSEQHLDMFTPTGDGVVHCLGCDCTKRRFEFTVIVDMARLNTICPRCQDELDISNLVQPWKQPDGTAPIVLMCMGCKMGFNEAIIKFARNTSSGYSEVMEKYIKAHQAVTNGYLSATTFQKQFHDPIYYEMPSDLKAQVTFFKLDKYKHKLIDNTDFIKDA